MPITSETVQTPVVDRPKSAESSAETRVRPIAESAVKAVKSLVYLANNLAEDQNRDQLAARFEEKLGRWGNDETAVSAINRFVHTYRTYVETFKQSYVPELSLKYLQSIIRRRKGEGLDSFLEDACYDIEEGGDAWKSMDESFGGIKGLGKLFGGEASYARELMLGALVDGYLKATDKLSAAADADAVKEAHAVRGRYIVAVSRVYANAVLDRYQLSREKVAGTLQTVAEGLGVWKVPEH